MKKSNNWPMVSFIHNGSGITTWMAHSFKTKSAVSHRGVVVITTEELHSAIPELRFCAGSSPAHDVFKIHDGEDL